MITVTLPYPISAKFGRITVLERVENDRFGRTQWKCQCECGTQRVIALFRLTSGHTKSCGCIRGKSNFRHGAKGTPTYNTWCAMKARCGNPQNAQYQHYGARGVTVCARWADSFEVFLEDMGERPKGMTIERNDNSRGYEPGNCRWATDAEQARNRRSTILVTRHGVTRCVKDWCAELGLDVDCIYGRIRRGATPEEALG